MRIQKKHIIVGAIGLFTVSGALAYWQYTKLMQYAIKLLKVKINDISITNVDVDITLNVTNNSDLPVVLSNQEHKVYINDILVSDISNKISQPLAKKSASPITIKVKIDPATVFKQLKMNAVDLLANFLDNKIRVEIKLKVGLWFLKFNIPYTYISTLRELTAKEKTEPVKK